MQTGRHLQSKSTTITVCQHFPCPFPIVLTAMSRSVVDATRFTATSPHAYAKPSPIRQSPYASTSSSTRQPTDPQQPSPSGSHPGNSPPPPPRETPHEKVARLRAQRIAARDAQLSVWERIVVRGRAVADRAHNFTVISLLGLTGTALLLYIPMINQYLRPSEVPA